MRRRGREPFSPDDLDLLAAFAAQASVVLELARSQQRERRLQRAGRPRPHRPRPARPRRPADLRHGAVAGPAQPLARQAEHPEAAARLSAQVDELDGTIARIRTAIFELQRGRGRLARGRAPAARRRGPAGDRGPRPAAATCGSAARSTTCRRELVPDLVAVVRELVTNVVRHAGAQRVTVTVDVRRRGARRRSPTTAAGCRRSPCAAGWQPGRPRRAAGRAADPASRRLGHRDPLDRCRARAADARQPVARSRSSVARIAAWVRRSRPSLASRWLV